MEPPLSHLWYGGPRHTLDEMPLVELSLSNHQRVTSSENNEPTLLATMFSLGAELYEFECKNPGFGFGGRFFGTMRQSKFAIFATWTLYPIVVYYPYMLSSGWPYVVTWITMTIGTWLMALYERAAMCKFMSLTVLPFTDVKLRLVFIPIFFCWIQVLVFPGLGDKDSWPDQDSWSLLVLACLGVILFARGEFNLHRNRKRGLDRKVPLEKSPNHEVSAYSYGSLQMPLGMLLMSWSMSLRFYLACRR